MGAQHTFKFGVGTRTSQRDVRRRAQYRDVHLLLEQLLYTSDGRNLRGKYGYWRQRRSRQGRGHVDNWSLWRRTAESIGSKLTVTPHPH